MLGTKTASSSYDWNYLSFGLDLPHVQTSYSYVSKYYFSKVVFCQMYSHLFGFSLYLVRIHSFLGCLFGRCFHCWRFPWTGTVFWSRLYCFLAFVWARGRFEFRCKMTCFLWWNCLFLIFWLYRLTLDSSKLLRRCNFDIQQLFWPSWIYYFSASTLSIRQPQ